jgi:hypothetical protein
MHITALAAMRPARLILIKRSFRCTGTAIACADPCRPPCTAGHRCLTQAGFSKELPLILLIERILCQFSKAEGRECSMTASDPRNGFAVVLQLQKEVSGRPLPAGMRRIEHNVRNAK